MNILVILVYLSTNSIFSVASRSTNWFSTKRSRPTFMTKLYILRTIIDKLITQEDYTEVSWSDLSVPSSLKQKWASFKNTWAMYLAFYLSSKA